MAAKHAEGLSQARAEARPQEAMLTPITSNNKEGRSFARCAFRIAGTMPTCRVEK